MPTVCNKIKLREGARPQVEDWAAELTRRADEVIATLKAEGVQLEAVFLDEQLDADYLIYVMHAEDLAHARAVGKASTAPIDAHHRAFKQKNWESSQSLPVLIDFPNF